MASDEAKQAYRTVLGLLRGVSHAEIEERLGAVRQTIEDAGIASPAKKARKRRGGHDRQVGASSHDREGG